MQWYVDEYSLAASYMYYIVFMDYHLWQMSAVLLCTWNYCQLEA